MAITIKELLASDTLSDAVDKINFNFDQLLLNGGGPQGPNGPIGPIGPIGGRGIRGTQWFEDPASSPGTNPNSLTFADLEEGDNYLQSDGTVWEWNGTVWVATSVNLTGPQGAAGTSGFSRFGNPINNQQSIYISPMPLAVQNGLGGLGGDGGASIANEAVPTLVVGGFVSITPTVSGLTYQKSLISDSMAQSIESTDCAMLVHQLESTSTAIKFMGGDNISDNYEQSNLANLAFISLISDDRLLIQVPKAPIDASSTYNLSGYIVSTIETGQYHQSGKHIHFITGQSSNSSGSAFENSDFRVTVNRSAGTGINPRILLDVTSIGGGLPASINIGSNTTIPASTTNTGSVIVTGGLIGLTGSSTIGLTTSSNISQLAVGNITLNSGAAISGTATGNITFNSNSTIQLIATNDLTIDVTDDIIINGGDNLTANITDDIDIDAGNDFLLSTSGASSTFEINTLSNTSTGQSGIIRILANTTSAAPAGLYNAVVPTGPISATGALVPRVRIRIQGNNHIRNRNETANPANNGVQILTGKDDHILLSGQMRVVGSGLSGLTGFGTATTMNWLRVGKVVHVSGYGQFPTCTGDTLRIPVPVVTSQDNINLDSSFGYVPRGTCIITSGFGSSLGVVSSFNDGLTFDIQKWTAGGPAANWDSGDFYTFTFAYTLFGG